jgi:hypothetical protein
MDRPSPSPLSGLAAFDIPCTWVIQRPNGTDRHEWRGSFRGLIPYLRDRYGSLVRIDQTFDRRIGLAAVFRRRTQHGIVDITVVAYPNQYTPPARRVVPKLPTLEELP